MQIFRKRPLCLMLSLLIAFMAAAPFMSAATKSVSVLAAAGIFIFSACFIKRDSRFGYKLGVITVALILAFATAARAYVRYDLRKYEADRIIGMSAKAEIEIDDIVYSDNYMTLLSGRMKSFGGEKTNLKVYLECEYMTDYDPGDVPVIEVTVYSPSEALEDGYTTRMDLLSAGYDVYCFSDKDIGELSSYGNGIVYYLEKLNSSISSKLISLLGEKSGSLAAALALGNDSRVDYSIERDFMRSGLSHILALSGSHIVLIIGTLEILLRKLAGAKKKIRYPILLISLPIYIIFVTSPIPVVRAGLMYAVFCVLEMLNKKSDSMTNLFVSAFVMIFFCPELVFSMSLWMSFTATLALVVFSPYINKMISDVKSKNKGKVFVALIMSVTSAAMIAFIGFLSNIVFMPVFGTFSTASVITNVVFGPLLTLYLILVMILILLLPAAEIAKLLAIPIKAFGDLILFGINRASAYKYSVISLEAGAAKTVCIVFFIIAAIYLVAKVKKKSIILWPTAALFVFLIINSVCFSIGNGNVHVVNIKESLNESMVVSYADNFSIIDISNGRLGNLNDAAREAKKLGACEFDSVVLTHYHRYHISAIRRFLQRETVGCVLLPVPDNDYDTEIYEKIVDTLNNLDTPYVIYANDIPSEIVDNVYIKAFPIERIKRSTHAVISFSVFSGEEVLTYVGASLNEGSCFDKIKERVSVSDTVILGRHGPIPKTQTSYLFSFSARVYVNDELVESLVSPEPKRISVIADKDGYIEFDMKSE